eukprot:CAMPEP_0172394604 /NCGR_PEP_ID=MMETSP1061-20121228/15630_1 /TAXON_ID=37318 /ORGANISM="Pseudo-nitzschia pungens, Strain cf. pungens" /LENGTH=1034 /DNA_ID=CAMNT_0013126003 /DNA_START=92 /DNA_END=3196 /DNA_ORIENTATION=-
MESQPTNDTPTVEDDRSGGCFDEESSAALPPAPTTMNTETRSERKTNQEKKNDGKNGRKLVGKKVKTKFGLGVVLDYRKADRMYMIQISNNQREGTHPSKSKVSGNNVKEPPTSLTTVYTMETPELRDQSPAEIANQLNIAYEALEKMRRLNLDVQCHELGIHSHESNHEMCTACLLENRGATKSHFPRLQQLMDSANTATSDFDVQEQFPRLRSFFNSSSFSVSSTTASSDGYRQGQIPRINNLFGSATSSVSPSESLATRISASLQAAHGSANTNTSKAADSQKSPSAPSLSSSNTGVTCETMKSSEINTREELSTVDHEENGKNEKSLAATNSDNISSDANSTTTSPTRSNDQSNSISAASKNAVDGTNGTVIEKQNPKRMSTDAAAAFSANPPPSGTNKTATSSQSFPIMRKLWGSVQSLPQPTASNMTSASLQGNSSNGSDSITPSKPKAPGPNKMPSSSPPASSSLSHSFPRMRGLLNSSVTTSIFGDNQVKENGSAADPSILVNGITSSQASRTPMKQTPTKSDRPIALPRIQRLIDKRTQANTSPCLICAAPSCPSHSSVSFRKEGITLCLKCERLFELDFIVDCVSCSDTNQRSQNIDYMVDCYDRCMLLLKYSKQFVKHIATSLEDQKGKQDKIGLASSSVGVLSGVLGIAAAASILTPAGPPLLIASLFFGGGATTVQTGTEAMNYFSEPRKLADRIIALHGMALSILRVTSTLRDAMLRDHIRTDVYEAEPGSAYLKNQMKESLEKNKNAVVMGSNFGRSLTLGVAGTEVSAMGAVAAGAAGEVSVVAGSAAAGASAAGAGASVAGVGTAGAAGARSATAFSRAGTAAARTVRFARFAGGALSAAVLVMEANAIQSTLKSINEGSHCDKADRLRHVIDEMDEFPSTSDLDLECQAYLTALEARPPPPVEAAVLDDSIESSEILQAECQQVIPALDHELSAPGVVIVNGVSSGDLPAPEGQQTPSAVPLASSRTSLLGGSSLFQRIQSRREERQSLLSSTTDEVVAVAVSDTELGESNYSLVL